MKITNRTIRSSVIPIIFAVNYDSSRTLFSAANFIDLDEKCIGIDPETSLLDSRMPRMFRLSSGLFFVVYRAAQTLNGLGLRG